MGAQSSKFGRTCLLPISNDDFFNFIFLMEKKLNHSFRLENVFVLADFEVVFLYFSFWW